MNAATRQYVDDELPLLRENSHADFNDGNLVNITVVSITFYPAARKNLEPEAYVDETADEASLVRMLKPIS